jgi:hypothetical protein
MHSHKNLFRLSWLTWKKSRILLAWVQPLGIVFLDTEGLILRLGSYYMQGFTVLSDFMSQNRPWQLVLTTYIWDGATLCDTKSGNHSTIWTGLCSRLLCVGGSPSRRKKARISTPRPHLWTIHVVTTWSLELGN